MSGTENNYMVIVVLTLIKTRNQFEDNILHDTV